MKVLLTGAAGQLGHALIASAPYGIELISTSRKELDLADKKACQDAVADLQPDWVLNAGAYTAVDKAETNAPLAHAVNAGAPEAFATALERQGGCMLQLSTDYVFSGSQGSPYSVEQKRNPIGVYGASKAAGEVAVQKLLGDQGRGFLLRTSWLVGPVGQNFALSMLRLHHEREELTVVADQVGCPTSTITLARACWQAIQFKDRGSDIPPVMHWSDAGAASWYDVAVAIGNIGLSLGLLNQPAQVRAISTADYPTAARRPSYSLLDCFSTRAMLQLPGQHWQEALQDVMKSIPEAF